SPRTVYLISGLDRRIWKSGDAGKSWSDTTGNFPMGDPVTLPRYSGPYNWSQANYDCFVTCHHDASARQDVLYVGLIDLVVSRDSGQSWTSLGRTTPEDALIHNDQHCVAVNPRDPRQILIGNDGGVYRGRYTRASGPAGPWMIDNELNARLGMT